MVPYNPYLGHLERITDGIKEAVAAVQAALRANGLAPLVANAKGETTGLLEAARQFNLVSQFVHLRAVAKKQAVRKLERLEDMTEAAKLFALCGLDAALVDGEAEDLAMRFVEEHLPEFGRRARGAAEEPMPLCQVLASSGKRAIANDAEECVDQFKRDCFKAFWDTRGDAPIETARRFEHAKIYESTNPVSAYQVEAAVHQNLRDKGAKHPTEVLFQKIGSGGPNMAQHYDGKIYGAYLLVRRGGAPAHWRRA